MLMRSRRHVPTRPQARASSPAGNGEERDEWEAVDAAGSSVEPGSQSGSYTEEEEVGIRLVRRRWMTGLGKVHA